MFNSILFDLDGTLLQTAEDLGAALNHLLVEHDLPVVSSHQYTPQASNGTTGLLKLGFGKQLENHDFNALRQLFLDYYVKNIAVYTQYFPQVEETLTLFNQQQIPWGIVTNKPTFLTTQLLKHFPLLEQCQVVVCGDTFAVAKPDPKPMNYAIQQLQVTPQHCLYLGDAHRDIEAGRNANMPTAVALYGYIAPDDDPQIWQADLMINEFSQLLDLIKP